MNEYHSVERQHTEYLSKVLATIWENPTRIHFWGEEGFSCKKVIFEIICRKTLLETTNIVNVLVDM